MGKWVSKQRNNSSKKYKADTCNESTKHTGNVKEVVLDNSEYPVISQSHSGAIASIDYLADTDYLLSGGKDGIVILQDLRSGEIKHKWEGHQRDIVKVRSGKNTYVSSSRDKTIKIWTIGNNNASGTLCGHELVVTGIDLDSTTTTICSGSRDNTVRLWDVETEACMVEETISRNLVTDLKWNFDNNLIVQTAEDKIIKLWDARNLEMIHTFGVQKQIQTSCATIGNICITANNGFGGQGCEICVWDIRQFKLLLTFRGHNETVSCCDISGNPQQIISCSHDGFIKLWKYHSLENGDEAHSDIMSSCQINGCGVVTCVRAINHDLAICGTFNSGFRTISTKGNLICCV